HPGGWQQWSVLNLLINRELDPAHACYVAYEAPIALLHLTDDLGRMQGKPDEIPIGTSVKNSQCAVRFVNFKVEGTLLTLTLEVAFSAALAGPKKVFLVARDKSEGNSGWLPAGSWEARPPAAPPRKTGAAPAKKGAASKK